MCDFHSTAWRLLGQEIQCAHLFGNSHGEAIKKAGWRENQPNKKIIIFEAEWSGEGDLPSDGKLIRNSGECPDKLTKRIRAHYVKLQEAITTGRHLNTYFADTAKWADVWNRAIANGATVELPAIFKGSLDVSGSAKLEALTKVGGSLDVYGSAKLEAPLLTEVGGSLAVSGSAKLEAPLLTEVGGSLDVSGSAKLEAPLLTEVGGSLDVSGSAKLEAPKLKRRSS